jgi:hypothetical protein
MAGQHGGVVRASWRSASGRAPAPMPGRGARKAEGGGELRADGAALRCGIREAWPSRACRNGFFSGAILVSKGPLSTRCGHSRSIASSGHEDGSTRPSCMLRPKWGGSDECGTERRRNPRLDSLNSITERLGRTHFLPTACASGWLAGEPRLLPGRAGQDSTGRYAVAQYGYWLVARRRASFPTRQLGQQRSGLLRADTHGASD